MGFSIHSHELETSWDESQRDSDSSQTTSPGRLDSAEFVACLHCGVVVPADWMLCKRETEARGSERELNSEAHVCLVLSCHFPWEASMIGYNCEPGDLPQVVPAAGTTGEAGCKGIKIS